MFKHFLIQNNISIYKLAELSKVPYSTLNELINGKKQICDCKIRTIENIANALNISIEMLLNMLTNKNIFLSNSWEENKNKKFCFPIIVENTNYECNRIHPLKQKIVNDIYEYVKDNNNIKKVIIFGSSVNIRCNKKSDIDIAIELDDLFFNRNIQNEVSESIQEICEYNSDIIWLNKIEQNTVLYNNIYKKGVVIYE